MLFGTYRTLLALAVILHHLGGFWELGRYAVFGFFILSGFLMNYILHESYGYTVDGLRKYAFKNVMVVLFDDLAADATATMKRICEFLRIDPEQLPVSNMKKVHNPNLIPRWPRMHRILSGKHPLSSRAVRQLRRIPGAAGAHNRLMKALLYRPRLSNQEYNELQPVFREDIERLESLLRVDLAAWKTPL